MPPTFRALLAAAAALLLSGLAACRTPKVGSELRRTGDEIVVAGRYFHTGTPVVLWTDVGGYDAYRVERRFVPADEASWEATSKAGIETPNRYGTRRVAHDDVDDERARAGQWTLDALRQHVSQFVIHYDVAGTSRNCFRVLHDARCLSVHFMIDLDGTIYQTLDAKERAWHAGVANDRSVGVEVANIGAYPKSEADVVLEKWYRHDEHGTRVALPADLAAAGVRRPNFVARPARPNPIIGAMHGREYVQYDFTKEQYTALARLAATLHSALPQIRLDAPRDSTGAVLTRALSESELASYTGLLGHCHVTDNKIDPGPALDWENLLIDARRLSGCHN